MHNPRLRDNVSTVKASSPLSGTTRKPTQTTTSSPSPDHVDQILVQVRRQIERWGEHARWKIDLVLLDPPTSRPGSPLPHKGLSPVPQKNSSPGGDTGARLQSLFQTQYGTGAGSPQPPALSIFGGATGTHSPWEYSAPAINEAYKKPLVDDTQQKLQDAYERQQHLEGIVRSQADQMKLLKDHPHDTEKAIETMQRVYLMTESEQKMRYALETKMLQTEIDTLSRKLRRVGATLRTVENIELSAEEAAMDTQHLLEDRKLMMRKLHLADLRLTARDAELEYLHETLRAYNAHAANHDPPLSRQSPTLQKQFRKGPPYLFQQQYSPKIRSDLRPPSQQSQWISGLDSLGILADQMLSNPDFEKAGDPETLPASPTTTTTNWRIPTEPSHLDLKRSKRSIDSANTLVAMPSFVITPLDDQQPTPYNRLDIRESPNSSHFATKKARLLDSSWTADDDVALRKTVEALGTNQWEKVAAAIPTKTLQQCRQRWSGLYGQPSEDPTTSRPFNARHTPSIAALLDSNEDLQMRQSTYSFHLNSPTYCQSPPQTDIQERP